MKLLVDHNLPPRLARALHTLLEPEHEITALQDKFGRSDLTDEEWITALGREGGWAVLTRDIRIARKRPSREAFLRAKLIGFFFSPAVQKWPMTRYAARVLTLWPEMVTLQQTVGNGVYEVPAKSNKFNQLGR